MPRLPREDYDAPWKEALERFFPEALELLFPAAHAGIDRARGFEFLDQELRQAVRGAKLGRRLVDKLARVWRTDGEEAWVLVHLEVQADQDPEFAERMYVYNYRLFDRYRREVASLAILADLHPHWRPDRFGYDLWGSRPSLEFPAAKLLDYRERAAELEKSDNPFALVVLAHLEALATRRSPGDRFQSKLRIMRRLLAGGWERRRVEQLLTVIEWLLVLPDELEQTLAKSLHELEGDAAMSLVSRFELLAEARGHRQGLREMVLEALAVRFRDIPKKFPTALEEIRSVPRLKELGRRAITAESLDEFRQALTTRRAGRRRPAAQE